MQVAVRWSVASAAGAGETSFGRHRRVTWLSIRLVGTSQVVPTRSTSGGNVIEELRDLLGKLRPDPWRLEVPFGPDFAPSHEELLMASDHHAAATVLSAWLARSKAQPCLFGRAAAALGLIHYCFVTEEDVAKGDAQVRDKIQAARLEWRRKAITGGSSGFVIVVLSDRIARAEPDETLMRFARRVAALYLLRDILADVVYHDDLLLEVPTTSRALLHWRVGANYFGAQGDGRWWHDHRIPGGLAFSMNSVGHLVKARQMSEAIGAMTKSLSLANESENVPKIDSLEKALVFAMKTIDQAAAAVSGPATYLLDRVDGQVPCPVELPKDLLKKDYCTYAGWYHTDVTVPSDYFRASVERPGDVELLDLDFTYLFDRAMENPDHITMGEGMQIRHAAADRRDDDKRQRSEGRAVPPGEDQALRKALLGG